MRVVARVRVVRCEVPNATAEERAAGQPNGTNRPCRRSDRSRIPVSKPRCWNPTDAHLNMGTGRIGPPRRGLLDSLEARWLGCAFREPHPHSVWTSHEAHVSAQPDPPPPYPRLPRPDEDAGRPQCLEAPPRQGAPAPRGHDRQQVSPGGDQRLRRCDRLRERRDFQRVSRDGIRANSASFVVLAAPSRAAAPACRLGVTASRRVGNAVQRNRVKRRIREWFRCHRDELPGGRDIVVIARQGAAALDTAGTVQQLQSAGGRLPSKAGLAGEA